MLAAGSRELGGKNGLSTHCSYAKTNHLPPCFGGELHPHAACPVCRSKRKVGLPASAGEYPASDAHSRGGQKKPAMCPSTTLGGHTDPPGQTIPPGQQALPIFRASKAPEKPVPRRGNTRWLYLQASLWSLTPRRAAKATQAMPAIAARAAPAMLMDRLSSTRSTSCSHTMGPPPSLELLVHPQVPSRPKENQQQDLVLALAHSVPWGPANRGSNNNS